MCDAAPIPSTIAGMLKFDVVGFAMLSMISFGRPGPLYPWNRCRNTVESSTKATLCLTAKLGEISDDLAQSTFVIHKPVTCERVCADDTQIFGGSIVLTLQNWIPEDKVETKV